MVTWINKACAPTVSIMLLVSLGYETDDLERWGFLYVSL